MLEFVFLIFEQLHQFEFAIHAGFVRRGAEMRVRHEQTVAVELNDRCILY